MHTKMSTFCSKSLNLAMLGSGSCMKALAGAMQPKSPPCGTKQQNKFALRKLTSVFLAHTPRDTPFVRETVAERQQKATTSTSRMSPLQLGFRSPKKFWLQWQVCSCLGLSGMLERYVSGFLEVFANPPCSIVMQRSNR